MTNAPKRILVATDFSMGSDEALEHAVDLAKQTGASLDIFYVLELSGQEFPLGLSANVPGGLLPNVDRELAQRAERVTAAGLACRTNMAEGSAATEIVQRARDVDADLIVVGTHGRRGLAHAFLGSVAERVVQHAPCPVLTVPFSKKAA
jgi:nucleotide-binding universal stress UspA family protein